MVVPRSWCLVAASAVVVLGACGTSGSEDTAGRDRCEAKAGVGQCVERNGDWVAIGSIGGTTSTTSKETTASTTSIAPTTTTTMPVAPTAAPPAGQGDVRAEPAGLFCRDLMAKGYSYSASVDYWRTHGQTNQMDADRNGIPCETVFGRSDVVAYWGTQTPSQPTTGLSDGLLCKDLVKAGLTYEEAVGYWFADGAPDRMDADGNGIPCETVYTDVDVYDYWYG